MRSEYVENSFEPKQDHRAKDHLANATKKFKYPNFMVRYLADAQYRMRLDEHGSGEEDVAEWDKIAQVPVRQHYATAAERRRFECVYVIRQCRWEGGPLQSKFDEYPDFPLALQD